jgi:glyoxylase-like metal-dependent hydrolase (beta-lactamase superfamily II)
LIKVTATDAMIKPFLPLFASLTVGVVANGAAAQASPAPLSLQFYNADAGSFHVNAVLVSGKTDAVLIDTGFTQADAHRIAAMVLDSRKTLKTIYISQADPDFYFGAGVLKTLFPNATLIASAPTVKKIQATLPMKLQVWGPRLGANAPTDVPLPEVMAGNTIKLERRSKSEDSMIHFRTEALCGFLR